ncbi:hypothetical protein [Paenibacillus sp. J2TS4]|uniref:hypothetical protein n=1 Tax=Paenibacillus sp. J2TS4 TaxID=2807194 RepID=UPI001B10ACBC|nr:hypothetical protein [Paenibacillus sp. J2TS4]GIP35531.1 hypothetical protein J2TS4_47410 [Paenibacillus sp. J2TS4]
MDTYLILIIVIGGLLLVGSIIFVIIDRVKRTAKEIEYGAVENHILMHVYGIPFCDNTDSVSLYIHPEQIILECKKKTYILKIDQILNVSMEDDKTIQAQIGTKVKSVVGIGQNLVLHYRTAEHDETKMIILQLAQNFKALGLVKTIKKMVAEEHKKQGVIEL